MTDAGDPAALRGLSNPPGGPAGPWADVPPEQWYDWRWQQANRLRRRDDFERTVGLVDDERDAWDACRERFEVAVTPYYASLMRPGDPGCPIRLQAIPRAAELRIQPHELADPLAEDDHMPVAGVTHRYPDRVLLYVTHNCPVYCRHCTRKRKVGDPTTAAARAQLDAGIAYVAGNPAVRDVLLSGGDPLTLADHRLGDVLQRLAAIEHVEVIRIGTRNPVTLPQRVDDDLCAVLRRVRPLYVHTHFNHPAECTDAAAAALERLADAGCVLGNQMVLLRGINDEPEVVLRVNRWLLAHRCRPYYLLAADMVAGISHFRAPLAAGLAIVDHLRGRISGMGIPHYVVDLPGGGGKVALAPDPVAAVDGRVVTFRSSAGTLHDYFD